MLDRTTLFILISLLYCSPQWLLAQFPSDYQDRTGPQPQQQKTELVIDTLNPDVYYFYLDNPAKTTLLQEKELHNFHVFDIIRRQEYDYINVGNFGSAARSIVYQPRFHKGFDAGFHNFDVYFIQKQDIRYYRLEKAYSDVTFTQGATQEQTNFSGKFSKNITPRTNLAVDYRRINNLGEYTNQRNRNTNFTINTWYHSKKQYYQAYLSYTTNTIQQLENGGVNLQDTTGNLSKAVLAIGRPVNTQNGASRYFQRDIRFSQYYRLQRQPKDSLNTQLPKKRQYTLFHQLNVRRNTYKYADDLNLDVVDSLYNGFLIDTRGIRQFMNIRQYENTFSIRTFQTKKTSPRYGQSTNTNSDTKDLIELGLTHTFTDIEQEPTDSSLHNIFLFGNIQFTPSERLKINTYAHLGTLEQIGDYYIKGDFSLNLPKIGKLELGTVLQHYTPNLLQQRLFITQQNVWSNNFNKTFENSFHASYTIPKLNIQLKAQYHLLSNYIYYNENAFPTQAGEDMSVLQFLVAHRLTWKGISFENDLYFQNANQDFLRLPSYYSTHRLSYTNRLFKQALEFQVGSQLRIHSPYFADGFQPATAQFFIQNESENTFYPNVDAFINFRIQDFRFFVNAQNIVGYFSNEFYYPIFRYPQFDPTIRFGFRWSFLD